MLPPGQGSTWTQPPVARAGGDLHPQGWPLLASPLLPPEPLQPPLWHTDTRTTESERMGFSLGFRRKQTGKKLIKNFKARYFQFGLTRQPCSVAMLSQRCLHGAWAGKCPTCHIRTCHPPTSITAALLPPSLLSTGIWGAMVLGSGLDIWGPTRGTGLPNLLFGKCFQGAWAGCWSPIPTCWHYTTAPCKAGQGWGSWGSRGCQPEQGPAKQWPPSWHEEGTLAPPVLSPALKEEGDISLAQFSLFSPKGAQILSSSPETYATGQRCSCPQHSAAFPCLPPPLLGFFWWWLFVVFFFLQKSVLHGE